MKSNSRDDGVDCHALTHALTPSANSRIRAMFYFFRLLCLHFFLTAIIVTARSQTPDKLLSLIKSAAYTDCGNTMIWKVNQVTIIKQSSFDSIIQGLNQKIAALDVNDSHYAIQKNYYESFRKSIEESAKKGEVQKTTLIVTLNMVSPSKWRIENWDTVVPENLATKYIANGKGVVYKVDPGQRRVTVSSDLEKKLSEALRGDPNFSILPALDKTLAPNVLKKDGIYILEIPDPESIQLKSSAEFDAITYLCTKVTKTDTFGHIYSKVSRKGDNYKYEQYDPSSGLLKQCQDWALVSKKITDNFHSLDWNYDFEPGYGVTIDLPNESATDIDSTTLIGKSFSLTLPSTNK